MFNFILYPMVGAALYVALQATILPCMNSCQAAYIRTASSDFEFRARVNEELLKQWEQSDAE